MARKYLEEAPPPIYGRVMPRPSTAHKDVDFETYNKSKALDAEREAKARQKQKEATELAIKQEEKRAIKRQGYIDSIKQAQEQFAQGANKPITEEQYNQAVNEQVLKEQEKFKEQKYQTELVLKSIGSVADGYYLYRGLPFLDRYITGKLLARANNGSPALLPHRQQLIDRYIALENYYQMRQATPDYAQMAAGAVGGSANAAQIATGSGDFIDWLGLFGGAAGVVGGSQVVRRRLGSLGPKLDAFLDKSSYLIQGVDLSKTTGELFNIINQ